MFVFFTPKEERIASIQTSLISVGGVISAFAIAYLSSKLFSIRQERINRKAEIDILADKLTQFRRLAYYLVKSESFWKKYQDIKLFKQKYSGLDFEDICLPSEKSDARTEEYWNKEQGISKQTISLYLSLEAIAGNYRSKNEYWGLTSR